MTTTVAGSLLVPTPGAGELLEVCVAVLTSC
jgi:hypothetical protein